MTDSMHSMGDRVGGAVWNRVEVRVGWRVGYRAVRSVGERVGGAVCRRVLESLDD